MIEDFLVGLDEYIKRLGILFIAWNEDGKIINISEPLSSLLKIPVDRLRGMNIKDIISAEFSEEVRKGLLLSENKISIVSSFKRDDETLLWLSYNIFQSNNPSNGAKYFTAQVDDITSKKNEEWKSILSEMKFSFLFEKAPLLIALSSLSDGKYVEVNEEFITNTGYSRNEIIGHSSLELGLITKEKRHELMNIIQQNGHVKGVEAHLKRKDGTSILCLYSGDIIEISDELYLFSIAQNITENRIVERELLKAHEELINLYTDLDEAVFSYDYINKKMIRVSDAHEKIFGYTSQAFFDNPQLWYELTIDEDKKIIDNGYQSLLEGKNHSHDVRIRKDGKIRWIHAKMRPVMNDEGQLVRVEGFVTDITERKHAEELILKKSYDYLELNGEYEKLNKGLAQSLEQIKQMNEDLIKAKEDAEKSDRLKTAFLENLSHEIRTPLNSVLGFSDLLSKVADDKIRIQEYTSHIQRGSIDLMEIIDDIIYISKIETGHVRIIQDQWQIEKLFDEINSLVQEYILQFKKQRLKFQIDLQHELRGSTLSLDKDKFIKILKYLLKNAVKFTNTGEITVRCFIKSSNRLQVHVKDTGIGIPADKQEIIFDRFMQVSSQISRRYGGAGIGLSIVKGILKLMNCTINVCSEEDKGSEFVFDFPFSVVEDKVRVNGKKKNNMTHKILLVEDDHLNALYIKTILAAKGYQIYHSPYGEKAIKMTKCYSFDLILMDIRLPDMSGFEVTKAIKEINPQSKIIAQTAFSTSNDRTKAKEAGCDEFISKPINSRHLYKLVDKLLNQNEALYK